MAGYDLARADLASPQPEADSPPPAILERIDGVDVARGLAVLGMFAAHVGPDPQGGGLASVLEVTHGRSSALFAVLAGVSIALLSGGHTPQRGLLGRRAAIRIAVRAALLVPLGVLLSAMGTGIEVILAYYGVYFLLALPALHLRTRTLAMLAALLAVLGPLRPTRYGVSSGRWAPARGRGISSSSLLPTAPTSQCRARWWRCSSLASTVQSPGCRSCLPAWLSAASGYTSRQSVCDCSRWARRWCSWAMAGRGWP